MNVLLVAALLIYTFGIFAYGALLGLWWQWLRCKDAGTIQHGSRHTLLVSGALWIVSFVWFVTNLVWVLLELAPEPPSGWLWGIARWSGFWLGLAFPPLIAHIVWTEARDHHRTLSSAWRAAVAAFYVMSAALGMACVAAFNGVAGLTPQFAGSLAGGGIASLFVGAALYSIAMLTRHPAGPETHHDPRSNRWHVALFGAMALMFVLVFALDRQSTMAALAGASLEIAMKSLPIVFMFVGTYFESRFEFFDIFVKRGFSLFITVVVLTGSFALVLPILQRYDSTWAAPWVYAVVLLPVAMALPWLHARISDTLDRRWLGRRFNTVEAVKQFLGNLRSATTEDQLVERAATGLSSIFDAPAAVHLHARTAVAPPFEPVQHVDIVASDGSTGRFLLGARRSEAPYFSQDVALLGSLGDVFSSVFDTLRLQQREQEQDRRARDLSLHASRSELKALRAQINPHFLFNALNAIAGLIHRDPAVADRTVEKLADVFRYTLRGSEAEWTLLDDELEFVRAYLDVEQARFGSRLRTSVEIADDARGARLPTMVVQTIVENAVKHGAASVKGQAIVSVAARREGDRLTIVVEDNGPGFPATDPAIPPSDRRIGTPSRSGYGLANVRRRLEGYFGNAAALAIGRDAARGCTTVSIVMPFAASDLRTAPAAAISEVRP